MRKKLRTKQATYPSYGITVSELFDAQRQFTLYARMRLLNAREYDRKTSQAFEDMDVDRLIHEFRDEVADAVNYLSFLDIQLSRWLTRLEGNHAKDCSHKRSADPV